MKRIKLKKLRDKILNLPRSFVEKRLSTLFLLLFLALLISFFVFFKSYVFVQKQKIEPKKVIKLDTEKLEKILEILEKRKEEFEKIEQREYKNPFSPL